MNVFKDNKIDVQVSKVINITCKSLINSLIKNPTNLNDDEKWHIDNYFYNIGFSPKLHNFCINNIVEYDNPVHIGIIIGLLSHYQHNIIEPFCPLQYTGKLNEIEKITEEWEETLFDIFVKTRKTDIDSELSDLISSLNTSG